MEWSRQMRLRLTDGDVSLCQCSGLLVEIDVDGVLDYDSFGSRRCLRRQRELRAREGPDGLCLAAIGSKCPIKVCQSADAACRINEPAGRDVHVVDLDGTFKGSLGSIRRVDWSGFARDLYSSSAWSIRSQLKGKL